MNRSVMMLSSRVVSTSLHNRPSVTKTAPVKVTVHYPSWRSSAGLGGQAEAEADQHHAGDAFEPALGGRAAQPPRTAAGQPGDDGQPQPGFRDEPQAQRSEEHTSASHTVIS